MLCGIKSIKICAVVLSIALIGSRKPCKIRLFKCCKVSFTPQFTPFARKNGSRLWLHPPYNERFSSVFVYIRYTPTPCKKSPLFLLGCRNCRRYCKHPSNRLIFAHIGTLWQQAYILPCSCFRGSLGLFSALFTILAAAVHPPHPFYKWY